MGFKYVTKFLSWSKSKESLSIERDKPLFMETCTVFKKHLKGTLQLIKSVICDYYGLYSAE